MDSNDLATLVAAAYTIAISSNSIPVSALTGRVDEILAAMIVTYNANKSVITA